MLPPDSRRLPADAGGLVYVAVCAMKLYANKRDAPEPGIMAALRGHGCNVWQLNQPGMADLLIVSSHLPYWAEGHERMSPEESSAVIERLCTARVTLQEVKNPEWRGKLTKAQIKSLQDGLPFEVVTNEWEALHAVGIRRG